LRAAELSGHQATLPTGPARPRPQAHLRVPNAPGRKAEAPRDLPCGGKADARVLRPRVQLAGRDRRGD